MVEGEDELEEQELSEILGESVLENSTFMMEFVRCAKVWIRQRLEATPKSDVVRRTTLFQLLYELKQLEDELWGLEL